MYVRLGRLAGGSRTRVNLLSPRCKNLARELRFRDAARSGSKAAALPAHHAGDRASKAACFTAPLHCTTSLHDKRQPDGSLGAACRCRRRKCQRVSICGRAGRRARSSAACCHPQGEQHEYCVGLREPCKRSNLRATPRRAEPPATPAERRGCRSVNRTQCQQQKQPEQAGQRHKRSPAAR